MSHIPNIDHFALSPYWLSERALFLSGPRQVGKTTYAQHRIEKQSGGHFNWDDLAVRQAYRNNPQFFIESIKPGSLIVFDEIHKRPRWKDILKWILDTHGKNFTFLITGSARLDTFRRSGDSLVGRYFLTHLFPLSVGDLANLDFQEFRSGDELLGAAKDSKPLISERDQESLLRFGGFPEPFLKDSERSAKRWRRSHIDRIIRVIAQ